MTCHGWTTPNLYPRDFDGIYIYMVEQLTVHLLTSFFLLLFHNTCAFRASNSFKESEIYNKCFVIFYSSVHDNLLI